MRPPRLLLVAIATLACGNACDSGGLVPEPDAQEQRDEPQRPPTSVGEDPPDMDAGPPTPAADAGLQVCGPAGECDLRDVDSCGDGQACVLLRRAMDDDAGAVEDATDPIATCVAAGTGADGDPCTGLGQCLPGLDCTKPEDGQCRRHCCELNTTRGCPHGQFCRLSLNDALGQPTGAALCGHCDACSPLGTDCPDGQACYPLASTGDGACHACLPAGTLPTSETCDHSNECQPGAACVSIASQRRCIELCELESEGCGSEAQCTEVASMPFGEGLGLCLEPET